MKAITSLLTFLLVAYCMAGCQQSTTTPNAIAGSSVAVEVESVAPVNQQQEGGPNRADKLLNKAGDIFKKATESSVDGTGVTKDWILEQIQQASGSQEVVPDDAADWARKMFDVLKDKGLTGASDAGEWVTEDFRNMNAFKYKVIKVSLDDLEALEDELNRNGQLKWECFYATERGGETILFFKKQKRSILKNIPVKDMLKIVPLMGNDE